MLKLEKKNGSTHKNEPLSAAKKVAEIPPHALTVRGDVCCVATQSNKEDRGAQHAKKKKKQ
jgi:hypothetical protein